MKSYNLCILMLCMNYRIPAIIGIIGIIFAIVLNSVSFAFEQIHIVRNWRIRIPILGVLEPREMTG